MHIEPLEATGPLGEHLITAALLAAEIFMERSSLSHKGYDAGEINDLLIKDLEDGVTRGPVSDAIVEFDCNLPSDMPDLSDDALRLTLINALKKCNELKLG